MTYLITDVLTISPATDWFFEDAGREKKTLSAYAPVAIFALVTYADDVIKSDVVTKRALPLDRHNFSDLEWMVGKRLEDFDTAIIHRTQIEGLLNGEELADDSENATQSEPYKSFIESRRGG